MYISEGTDYCKRRAKRILSFARAATSCAPVVVAIFLLVSIYALASKDIFHSKVVDPLTAQPYFDTFSRSFATLFRMFSGDWHGIMYEAAEATTEAAQLWFISYEFLISVLCSELFVGVVMAFYEEVQSITSPRIFNYLAPTFEVGTLLRAAK